MIKLKFLIAEGISPGIDGVINRHFGWLTNRGEFWGTELWEHLESLRYLPLPNNIKAEMGKWLDELKELRKDIDKRLKAGEHIGHEYDMADAAGASKIAKEMYKAGWIRIGWAGGGVWEFEGTPEALKNRMPYIRKFKNKLEPGFEIKFTPRKI